MYRDTSFHIDFEGGMKNSTLETLFGEGVSSNNQKILYRRIEMMKRLSVNERGFTLIELAIVMVIIGILIGAVLKGQDLIQNARAKKFVNKVRAWEVADWTFYDRKGYFPGDSGKNGKIADNNDGTTENYKNDLTSANFINPPYPSTASNTIVLGSYSFYVFHGTDSNGKNVITICLSNNCTTEFDDTAISYAEALDVAIDGTADGASGQVIGVTSAPDSITANEWEASWTTGPTAASYSSTTGSATKAIVYYFDAKK